MSTRLHIVVPPEMVAEIDERRGLIPRSAWIVRALEAALAPHERFEDGKRVVDVDLDAPPARPTRSKVGLPQFRCGVCGIKTVGGPCVKHGSKHAEEVA